MNTHTTPAFASGMITHGEIMAQPDLWPTTLEAVRASRWRNEQLNRPVIITGAGTSAYASEAIASAWPNAQAIATTDLLIASRAEIERRLPGFADSGLLISVARSGDSPESVAVVERTKKILPGANHLAITCNAEGRLANTAGVRAIVLDPRTNDRGLAMTSSFSNLVLAGLYLQRPRELEDAIKDICESVRARLNDWDARAQRIASERVDRVVVLGSGALRALASEASLKILEMTAGGVPTLPETFLGLRHGPMSFLTPHTMVLCLPSSSPFRRQYEQDVMRELRAKKLGRIVAIAPHGSDNQLADEHIDASAGSLPDELRVPFEVPFAQLLAFRLSLKHGLDPDNPSPMGAITRVVKTFRIYDAHEDV